MVLLAGNDPAFLHYQCSVMPLYYKSIWHPLMDSNHRMSESKSDALPTWRRGYNLARPEGFEPPTPTFVALYSIQMNYGRILYYIEGLSYSQSVRALLFNIDSVIH